MEKVKLLCLICFISKVLMHRLMANKIQIIALFGSDSQRVCAVDQNLLGLWLELLDLGHPFHKHGAQIGLFIWVISTACCVPHKFILIWTCRPTFRRRHHFMLRRWFPRSRQHGFCLIVLGRVLRGAQFCCRRHFTKSRIWLKFLSCSTELVWRVQIGCQLILILKLDYVILSVGFCQSRQHRVILFHPGVRIKEQFRLLFYALLMGLVKVNLVDR